MKTIILCGGKGMRLHQETEFKPKPMVKIGPLPMLVHIMKLYQAYGYDEFVLALGYRGEVIRDYFLHLKDSIGDFTYDMRTHEMTYHNHAAALPFKITFVDTGEDVLSGERALRCMPYVAEDTFMITYGDGVSNVHISDLVAFHERQRAAYGTLATITTVHPSSKYGQIVSNDQHIITTFAEKPVLNDYINGGFMVFHKEALQFFRTREMLETIVQRMVEAGKVSEWRHEGFWHSMDTMKDVNDLTDMWEKHKSWNIH